MECEFILHYTQVVSSLQEELVYTFSDLESQLHKSMAHFILFLLLESVIGKPQIAPELFLNRLNISYGMNHKYIG